MDIIESFPGLVGFYVLNGDGQLGIYEPNKKFVVDAKLTKAFGEYNRRFLMAYQQNPGQGNFRLAIIHRTQEKRPWGSETLLFEKSLVRRLYSVTGMTAELDLTAFQKKNREKSIYRGMEIMLEYQDTASPDLPVYCPVLYDCNTRLGDYASDLDRQLNDAERDTPVVEILNLLAGIPMGKRISPEIGVLKEKIYQGIVKKGMRKAAEFTLIEDIRRNAESNRGGLSGADPYGEDKRTERQVTFDARTGSTATHPMDDAFIKHLSSSLVGRPEPADPQLLRIFTRFREMDRDQLEALAAQTLVYKVPPGTQLLERGTNDSWNLYLIDGSVQLVAADGVSKVIEGGTPTAANPISCLKPRMYTISSVTRVAFLWIDDKLIEQLLQDKPGMQLRDGTI